VKFSALCWVLGALLFAVSILVNAQPVGSARPEIVPSHAFSGTELTDLPLENWITNGGNSLNQRYSPLTQINRFNVKDLKALWKTEMGSGDQYKNGGQAQILHYKGTMFVANGMNDVFAMGDGKIFTAQIDAKLKALDQTTGEVVWEIMAEDWTKGFSITSAPVYYNGLIVTGFSGG